MKKLYYKYIKNIVVLTSLLLLISCKSSVYKNKESGKNIFFETLITNSHSNIDAQKNIIIQKPEELQEIFNTINTTRKPSIALPTINFEKVNVAFINIGQTSTGGHSVSVTEIIEKEEKVVIYYEGKGPKAGENATMVLTSPFTMVKFNKQTKPIVFEWKLKINK